MNVTTSDEWVTTVYENCAVVMEDLQSKNDLTVDEEGLHCICEVVIMLYEELHGAPAYIRLEKRILH
jgi:hypothetical protein